jgi:hypothetical protein
MSELVREQKKGRNDREFHLADIMSVSTSKLCSRRGVEALYDLLGFMTGESLYTHALIRAGEEMEVEIKRQLPFLNEINADHVNEENVRDFVAEMIAKYGTWHRVFPARGRHESKDPIAELREMRPDAKIIAVVVPDEGGN